MDFASTLGAYDLFLTENQFFKNIRAYVAFILVDGHMA
jgi:hypothetical protein